jgi:glutathione S-transferase
MKLIGWAASPFVRKVRVVLAEKKVAFTYAEENIWASETTIDTMNPLGKVPCLVLEGGEALFDSRVIVEYLDGLSPLERLIPPSGRQRAEVKTWEALADGVMEALVLARLEATWPGRTEAQRSPAWMSRQMHKVDRGLDAMERGLSGRYCSGNSLSLADIAVGCALGYLDLRFAQVDWRGTRPRLADLHQRLLARESFASTQAQA